MSYERISLGAQIPSHVTQSSLVLECLAPGLIVVATVRFVRIGRLLDTLRRPRSTELILSAVFLRPSPKAELCSKPSRKRLACGTRTGLCAPRDVQTSEASDKGQRLFTRGKST
jgi:hypothetical protein